MNTNIQAQALNAMNRANAAYIARNPVSANLNKEGINPDIAEGIKIVNSIRPEQFEALAALGVDVGGMFESIANATNIKKSLRIADFAMFVLTGDKRNLRGSAKTALMGFCALMIGARNKNGLNFTVTGKGDENTSDSLPSVQRARSVLDAFGAVGVNTAPTQLSVAFSKGGILPSLGLSGSMSKGEDLPALTGSEFCNKLVGMIERATDSQISLWVNK